MAMHAGKLASLLLITIGLTTYSPVSACARTSTRAARDYEALVRDASHVKSQPLSRGEDGPDEVVSMLKMLYKMYGVDMGGMISLCQFFERFYVLFCAGEDKMPVCEVVYTILVNLPFCTQPCYHVSQLQCKPCHECQKSSTVPGLCAPGYVCCHN